MKNKLQKKQPIGSDIWMILSVVVSIIISVFLAFYVSSVAAIAAGCACFLVFNMLLMFAAQDNSTPLTKEAKINIKNWHKNSDVKNQLSIEKQIKTEAIVETFCVVVYEKRNQSKSLTRAIMTWNTLTKGMTELKSGINVKSDTGFETKDIEKVCKAFPYSYENFSAFFKDSSDSDQKKSENLRTSVMKEFCQVKGPLLDAAGQLLFV